MQMMRKSLVSLTSALSCAASGTAALLSSTACVARERRMTCSCEGPVEHARTMEGRASTSHGAGRDCRGLGGVLVLRLVVVASCVAVACAACACSKRCWCDLRGPRR